MSDLITGQFPIEPKNNSIKKPTQVDFYNHWSNTN